MLDAIGDRPRDFYGPEDYDGTEPWEAADARIQARQTEWDRRYAALTWWQKVKRELKALL